VKNKRKKSSLKKFFKDRNFGKGKHAAGSRRGHLVLMVVVMVVMVLMLILLMLLLLLVLGLAEMRRGRCGKGVAFGGTEPPQEMPQGQEMTPNPSKPECGADSRFAQ